MLSPNSRACDVQDGCIGPLKQIEYAVYGHLIVEYPKPCSIYIRGTINGDSGEMRAIRVIGGLLQCVCPFPHMVGHQKVQP